MAVPAEAAIVFGLIGIALVLFVSESIPSDTTALGIIVSLALLEPVTGVSPRGAISGFANPATVTIVAMFMLSAGIQQSGLVQRLGYHLAAFTDGDEGRTIAATVASTGTLAGFVNNTPVVAVFIPMITDLADRTGISPSKLLLPLSFAAILGGTLTVIGTSTNILASDLTQELLQRPPIGMFEFTKLSIIIVIVGVGYLLTVGRWLTPERIPPNVDLVREFGVSDHLLQAQVRPDSVAIGKTVGSLHEQSGGDVRILQHLGGEDGQTALEPSAPLEAGDRLTLHGAPEAIRRFLEEIGCRQLPQARITEDTFARSPADDVLGKVVIPPGSSFVEQTVGELRLHDYHDTAVLAIKRREEVLRTDLGSVTLEDGDTLLVQTTPDTIEYFADDGDLVPIEVTALEHLADGQAMEKPTLDRTAVLSVGILVGVIAVAASGVTPIVIAALAGVFAMVVSGVLTPSQAYEAVSWDIVFLLAGVIPLGLALEQSGGAEFIGGLLVGTADVLPLVGVAILFYFLTSLLANLITPVATVVLMIPIAVEAALTIDANAFAFLLVVMFAAATSFMTPIGYQTNLMVYGPGGYRFTDYIRVGAPLQLMLAVITPFGVAFFWGLT